VNSIRFIAIVLALFLPAVVVQAAPSAPAGAPRMVIVVSRHGVRSPTHPGELQPFARQQWPAWSGKPGYLTPRGAILMQQYGVSYRRLYGAMLGGTSGCPAAGSVFVWADVDQRTVATGDAVLRGFAPNCGITVGHAPADPDHLFDPLPGIGVVDKATSKAAVLGAVGNDFAGLTDAYGAAYAALEHVLGCTQPAPCKSIANTPTTVANDGDGGLAGLSGGLDAAADVAENLLLEYTDGHPNVGWGRVDHARLLQLLQFHVLGKQIEHANWYAARAHSSNIMAHVLQTLQEGVDDKAVAGTRVPPGARFVFLSGHDTQLTELGGLLGLSWLIPGDQFNDTPPGSAIVFELYGGAQPFVRTYFSSQTLDAMRSLHGENPVRVPVYVPGCPAMDCPFATFSNIVNAAIDPSFVAPW
jgi:4-phytase/acid phosphatase